MKAKITKRQFKLFKRECKRWIEYFGLKQWQVNYFFEKCDNRAEYYVNISGALCSIVLNTHFENVDKVTDKEIKKVAFHEVVEGMLFSHIKSLLFDSGYSRDKASELIHPIIRTFENTIFRDIDVND